MLQILTSSHPVDIMIICKGLSSTMLQEGFDQQCLDLSAELRCVTTCVLQF